MRASWAKGLVGEIGLLLVGYGYALMDVAWKSDMIRASITRFS